MNLSGIYKIQSKVKPERIYIGSAVKLNNRYRQHFSDLRLGIHINKKLQNHCNKYGIQDLAFSILLCCERADLIKTEQYFIDSYNPYFNINKIAGSRLGMKCSDELIEKMRIRMIGTKLHQGYRHSEETKKKMSLRKLGHTPWNKGGAEYSLETRNKMSIAKKGRKLSDETKMKISEARKKHNKKVS